MWMGLLIALMCLIPLAGSAEAGLRGYSKDEKYQYVQLGEYPYEADGTEAPVLWRVLEVENGQALLLTEYVIDARQIIFETDPKVIENHSFRRISSFAESDLYAWLNSEGLDTLLGDDPIRNALREDEWGAKLSLLTKEQYLDEDHLGFSKGQWGEALNAYPRRQAVGTPYAVANKLYVEKGNGKSPYWCIAIKDTSGYFFGLVGFNGHISWGAYTNIKVAGLRLAIRLDLSQLEIASGLGTMENPYVLSYAGDAPAAPQTDTAEKALTLEASAAPTLAATQEAAAQPTPSPAPSPEPAAEKKNGVVLSFVGDCSVGESVQYKNSSTSYHTTIDTQGYAWPFSLVKDYLAADDLTVANLEVVLTTRTRVKDKSKLYNLIADPDHVEILKEGSVEMVNTVNNHCMDFDYTGYQDSLDNLDAAGILRFGTVYPNLENGHDDYIAVDVGDIRFGFVGFTYPQDSDQKRIAARIQKLRQEQGCDVVIVSLHWGRETHMTPEEWQIKYAKLVIDAGADMIWGHHPHVIQPIHFYQGKPILYSTGNFTFGTMSQVDPSTGIFQVTYEKVNGKAELRQLQVIPCRTQASPDFRPYELTDPAERRSVFTKLTFKKNYAKCENLPASFLDTGIVRLENGQLVP